MKDRIATVLRVRTLSERRAAGALAGAEQELRRADELVARRRADTLVPPAEGVLRPLQLRALELQRLARHELVEAALSERELSEVQHGELARAWTLASIQRRSAERLSERRSEVMATMARTAADRALDEAALLRWEAS